MAQSWDGVLICSIIGSVLFYFAYGWVSSYMTFSKTYLAFEMTFSSPSFYTTVFLCTAVIFLFEYGVMTIRINLFPSCADYFRVLVSKKQSKITEREAGEIH